MSDGKNESKGGIGPEQNAQSRDQPCPTCRHSECRYVHEQDCKRQPHARKEKALRRMGERAPQCGWDEDEPKRNHRQIEDQYDDEEDEDDLSECREAIKFVRL